MRPVVLISQSDATISAHKGYGLSVWVDLFCGALSGFGFTGLPDDDENVNHFFGAWRVDAFTPTDAFKTLMDERLRELKATVPAPGFDRVMVAEQPQHDHEQDCMAHGVPLQPTVVDWLRGVADEDGIPFELSFSSTWSAPSKGPSGDRRDGPGRRHG